MKNEYNLTVFRQSRILVALFLSPIILIITILIGAEFKSFIIAVLFLVFSFSIMYYFVVGNLKITIEKDIKLNFKWEKKIIFNYNLIKPININEIESIILDGDFLRKIRTNSNIIYINNSKIKPKDSNEFIKKLKDYSYEYDIRIIDSWEELQEKGYLKIAYTINSIVIIVSILSIIILTYLKGFKPVSLSIILLFIPQMLLYRAQMKDKIR